MRDQLRKALDQALTNHIGVLFSNLAINSVNQPDTSLKAFTKGMSLAMESYGRACLVIDQMTEV